MKKKLYTIGHSNHAIEDFLSLLKKYSITAVADVRSAPYSSYNPQYNKETINTVLNNHHIKYIFLGKELGARPDDPSCYTNNQVDFNKLQKKQFFIDGINRILEEVEQNHFMALMCSEKDPLCCHRTILICRYLKRYPLEINHILYDGRLENHANIERRLMHNAKVEPTLFEQNTETLINTAYNIQSEKISYATERG